MPLFVFIGRDAPDALELRRQNRPRHLDFLRAMSRNHRIVFAGPLKDETGTPRGSMFVFEAESLSAARTLTASDPYAQQGVFESMDLFETMQVFP